MVGATMNAEPNPFVVRTRRIDWRRAVPWLLGLAVLSAIVLGPWGLLNYVAGFLKSIMLAILLGLVGLVGWGALLVVACIRFVRDLRGRRKLAAVYWSGLVLGIVLASVLQITGRTPAAIQFFAHGVSSRLAMQIDIDAVQTWVESLKPSDCLGNPHGSDKRRLSIEDRPHVLGRQSGDVDVELELDTEGRPCVRLSWNESKAGIWGFVIGHRNAKTPPSEPEMYGEKRMEMRPGVYFWYKEG